MEIPLVFGKINFSKFHILSFLFLLIGWVGLKSQDISMSSDPFGIQILTERNLAIDKLPTADYPECPDPVGVVRFIFSNTEIVRFVEPVDQNRFHYEIRLKYKTTNQEPVILQVLSGEFYSIEHDQYGVPDEVEVRRVCHQLGSPFIYESFWKKVPIVQESRTTGDTICDQFNGADVIFYPENNTFDFNCYFAIKRGSYTIDARVLLEIDYCEAQDSQLYIYDFPFVYSAGSNEVCVLTLILQYQTPDGQWHQCDEIIVYENEDISSPGNSNCDGNHPDIIFEDSDLLTTLVGVQIFYVGGFAVNILHLSGPLTGTGSLTLPFQDKKIIIEFDNIDVNQDFQVIHVGNGSSITALSSCEGDIPHGNLSIGSETCIPPQDESEWNENGTNSETGELWDPHGFGQDGQYAKVPPYPEYKAGDPFDPNYDPCGFNGQGIHKETGTKYNLNGCSRDSLNAETPPQHCALDCIPYYWLQEPEATNEGLAFFESISEELPDKVDSLLEVIQSQYESQLSIKEGECANIAGDMREIVSNNEIDSLSIFGPNSEYIRPGLSERFVRKPESFKPHMVRNVSIVNLEKLHINLYECDEDVLELQHKLELIQNLIEDKDALMEYLEIRIKGLTPNEISSFTSTQIWLNKLKSLIELYILNQVSQNGGIGYVKPKPNFDFKTSPTENIEYHNATYDEYAMFTSLVIEEATKLNISPLTSGPDGNILPLDISIDLGGETYTITIVKIGFFPEYLTVDAYIRLDIPFSAEQIVFSCHDLQFSPNGLIGAGVLTLEDTIQVKLFNVANLVLNPENTFVEWDCSGFKRLDIDGYIEFCRNTIIPLDSTTHEPLIESEEKVKAYFQTSITSFDDFYAALTIEPFAVTSQPNIRFEVEDAYLDMSTLISPEIYMPLGYTNEHCDPVGVNQMVPNVFWQGFYIGHLNATVITGVGNDAGIAIDVYDAVIDDRGFSGLITIDHTIKSLDTSNIGKWAFSIDKIRFHFLFNNLIGGGFEGLIHVPIFKAECTSGNNVASTDCFEYTADYLSNQGLQFSVSPKSNVCAKLWKNAVVNLDSNTVLNIIKSTDDFFIEAKLYGWAYLDLGGFIAIDTVRFENVRLRNKSPYFSPGVWYCDSIGLNIGGFGLTVENVTLDTLPGEHDKIRLNFVGGVEVNTDFSISAKGGFSIYGKIFENNNRQRWDFEKLSVNSLFINVSIKGTQVTGFLKYFDNNTTYGNGFKAAYIKPYRITIPNTWRKIRRFIP